MDAVRNGRFNGTLEFLGSQDRLPFTLSPVYHTSGKAYLYRYQAAKTMGHKYDWAGRMLISDSPKILAEVAGMVMNRIV